MVAEAGIPMSSVYHLYSKDGILLEPLAPALAASRRVLLAAEGREGRRARTGRRA